MPSSNMQLTQSLVPREVNIEAVDHSLFDMAGDDLLRPPSFPGEAVNRFVEAIFQRLEVLLYADQLRGT